MAIALEGVGTTMAPLLKFNRSLGFEIFAKLRPGATKCLHSAMQTHKNEAAAAAAGDGDGASVHFSCWISS